MAFGRPVEYSNEALEKALEYIQGGWEKEGHAFPSVVGLCSYINRSRSTVYKWAQEEGKEDFSDILSRINETQELVAWARGLKGDYNATLVKLLLGKHGYHERSELTGAEGGPVQYTNMTDDELNHKLKSLVDAVGSNDTSTED